MSSTRCILTAAPPRPSVWSVVGPMKSVGLRGSQGNDFWPDSNTPIAKEGMRMVPRRVKTRRLTESLQGWTQLIHVGLRGFQGKGQKIIWYNLCCRMSGASMPAVLVAQCHGMCACTWSCTMNLFWSLELFAHKFSLRLTSEDSTPPSYPREEKRQHGSA